jgi:DNA-binding MarR family transcriptional regulator
MKQLVGSIAAAEPTVASEALAARDRLYRLLDRLDEMVGSPERPGAPATVERIRSILKARRLRARFFEAELFADPAWDMLLELYAAQIGHYRLAVSSLCMGAAVPTTTALRWIKSLETKHLIVRIPDPSDGRRVFITLSHHALEQMDSLFRAAPAEEQLL